MVSSNNLYHFTPKLEYLESILKEKRLRVQRCLEDFSWLDQLPPSINLPPGSQPIRYENMEVIPPEQDAPVPKPEQRTENNHYAIPSLLLDIPSNLISKHSNIYGRYGIGFKKSWARGKGINPLLYLVDYANPISYLQSLDRLTQSIHSEDPDYSHRNALVNLLSYTKPYEGEFRGQTNYRFYDEREWRYVPPANLVQRMKPTDWDKFDQLSFDEKTVDYLDFRHEDVELVVVSSPEEDERLQKAFPDCGDKVYLMDDFAANAI